jgi:hypothetical protein
LTLAVDDVEKKKKKKWYSKVYLSADNQVKLQFLDFLEEFREREEPMDEDEEQDSILKFNHFSSSIFEKYMQIALFDLASKNKEEATKLSQDYFEDWPVSAFENLDDYKVFQNFTENDLQIEAIRNAKYLVMIESVEEMIKFEKQDLDENDEEDKIILKELDTLIQTTVPTFIVTKILNKTEESIYNTIMNKLQPGSKWSSQESQTYIEKSKEIFEAQKEDLDKFIDRQFDLILKKAKEESE